MHFSNIRFLRIHLYGSSLYPFLLSVSLLPESQGSNGERKRWKVYHVFLLSDPFSSYCPSHHLPRHGWTDEKKGITHSVPPVPSVSSPELIGNGKWRRNDTEERKRVN